MDAQTNEAPLPMKLHAAVLEAQRAIKPVIKDKVAKVKTKSGAEYEYKFASTDDVMAVARDALLAHGVLTQRVSYEIVDGKAGAEVMSTFRMVHPESGEQEEYPPIPMPISGQGAADKVLAAALTFSWSYWLRDVLAIPRKDENSPDNRSSDEGTSRFRRGPRCEDPAVSAPVGVLYRATTALSQLLRTSEQDAGARVKERAGLWPDGDLTDAEAQRLTTAARALIDEAKQPQTKSEPELPKHLQEWAKARRAYVDALGREFKDAEGTGATEDQETHWAAESLLVSTKAAKVDKWPGYQATVAQCALAVAALDEATREIKG